MPQKVEIDAQRGDPPRDYVEYLCPGCGLYHRLPFTGEKRPKWSFDGNLENPTISPSINSWQNDQEGKVRNRCHHFVRNGQIEFLGDCTHALKGQTVTMLDIDVDAEKNTE